MAETDTDLLTFGFTYSTRSQGPGLVRQRPIVLSASDPRTNAARRAIAEAKIRGVNRPQPDRIRSVQRDEPRRGASSNKLTKAERDRLDRRQGIYESAKAKARQSTKVRQAFQGGKGARVVGRSSAVPKPTARPGVGPARGIGGIVAAPGGGFRAIPGIAGPIGRTDTTALQIDSLSWAYWLGESLVRSRAERNRRILAVGRRGALATPRPTAPGFTNRTGALATRAPAPAAPAPARASNPLSGVGKQVASQVDRPLGSRNTSKAPQTRSSSTTRSSTSSLPSSSSVFRPLGQVQVRLQSWGQSLLGQALGPRSARVPSQLASPGGAGDGLAGHLTSFDTPGVGSRRQNPNCNCETQTRRKSRKERCENPVISKTTSGDVQTIKRRLQCPSSRT